MNAPRVPDNLRHDYAGTNEVAVSREEFLDLLTELEQQCFAKGLGFCFNTYPDQVRIRVSKPGDTEEEIAVARRAIGQ